MPRIVFIVVQLALLAVIILMSTLIVRKQMAEGTALPATPGASRPAEPDQTAPDGPKPFAHYQVIARRDLFKTPKDAEPAKAAIDIETLKPTNLKLKLWGTITGEDGMTRAVIEDQTKRRQAFYRAGDEISSAQLKMILREKVILSVKGEDQVLEIEKPSSTARPAAPRAAARRAGGRPEQTQPPPARSQPAQQKPARRTVRLKLSRLGPISEDPEDWNSYAAASPYKDENGASGLALNKITPSSPFRRLGIRNGDIILGINDQQVDNLGDVVKSLAAVSAGEELSLKIKRRGRERQLDFQFE